jgi:putative tricarboxylic transport membrane protein
LQNRTVDRIGGILTALIGLVAIAEALRLYPYRTSFFVGDHTMPGVVGGALVLLGLLLAFSAKGERITIQFPDRATLVKIALTLGGLFLYWILLQVLGYIISTFIIAICFFMVIGSYRFAKSLIYALVMTACLYVVFIYWLSMPFPLGMLGI